MATDYSYYSYHYYYFFLPISRYPKAPSHGRGAGAVTPHNNEVQAPTPMYTKIPSSMSKKETVRSCETNVIGFSCRAYKMIQLLFTLLTAM